MKRFKTFLSYKNLMSINIKTLSDYITQKKTKLEVNTQTLSSSSIKQLLQNNLSQACLSIPYSDIVVESIKIYFEEKVYRV
jgi:hypothetical protein